MKYTTRLIIACLCTVVTTAGALLEARPQNKPQTAEKAEGVPVLWRDPGAIATKDLYWGIGGPEQAPQPPFTFIEEDARGTKPKVTLRDARGMTWNVKWKLMLRHAQRETVSPRHGQ